MTSPISSTQLQYTSYLITPFLDLYKMVVCVFVYQRKEFIGHMVFIFNRVDYCCNTVWNGWRLCCQQLSVMMSVFPTLFHTYIFKNFNCLCSKISLCCFKFYYPYHYWIWISSIGFSLVFLKLPADILHQFLLDYFLLIYINSYIFIHSLI